MVSGQHTLLALASCAALAFPGAAVVGTADADAPLSTSAVLAPTSPCESYDLSGPSVTDISVSPASVDVTDNPAVITVHAEAHDNGAPGVASGINHFEVTIAADTPGGGVHVLLRENVEGDWSGTATLYPGVPDGTWRVASAYLWDGDGKLPVNRTSYGPADLAGLGIDAELEVVSPVLDTEPPTLEAFTFTPSKVNTTITAKTMTFTATATDDVSGIDTFIVGLANDPGRNRLWAELLPLAGSPDTYQGSVLIPRWVGDMPWSVDQVFLEDNLKRRTWLDTGDLADLGFKRTFLVDSGQDFGLPTLAAHSRTPSTVDTRTSNKKVTVQVRLRDAKSGVAGATASFRSTDPGYLLDGSVQVSARLTRVSGTRYDGVWRGVVTVPRCTRIYTESYPSGIPAGVRTWNGTVTFSDRAGNRKTVGPTLGSSADIRVNSRDNKPPLHVENDHAAAPEGPVRLRFTEAVTGINNTSLIVVPGDYDDEGGPQLPIILGPPAAGTWTCRNVDGVVVSCQTGRIRYARFDPIEPFAAGSHLVIANTRGYGTLDFRDLAGNAPRHNPTWFIVG